MCKMRLKLNFDVYQDGLISQFVCRNAKEGWSTKKATRQTPKNTIHQSPTFSARRKVSKNTIPQCIRGDKHITRPSTSRCQGMHNLAK